MFNNGFYVETFSCEINNKCLGIKVPPPCIYPSCSACACVGCSLTDFGPLSVTCMRSTLVIRLAYQVSFSVAEATAHNRVLCQSERICSGI